MRVTTPSKSLLQGVLACALFAIACPVGAQTTWFPLVPGLRWVYQNESGSGVSQTVAVVEEQVEGFLLDFNGQEVLIAYGYDIILPGEPPAIYYRFDEESFLHRDFRGCDDSRILAITARDEVVSTPSGEYTGCLKIEYEPGGCADAGTFVEWWAPEVGKVKWVEGSFIGPRTWVLTKFFNGGPVIKFRRGDADGDTTASLTDAVGILNYLFQDGEPPACADAADVNDDGVIDIGDAVKTIFFLFQAGDYPPQPGPDFCGEDPTEDQLAPCDPGTCLPR